MVIRLNNRPPILNITVESILNAHYRKKTKIRTGDSLTAAYVIFFLSASFYLYEFILQVAPSVMAESLMKTFGVTAQGFGFISAFYFYAYLLMQVLFVCFLCFGILALSRLKIQLTMMQ